MRGCWGVHCANCSRTILLPVLDFTNDLPMRPVFSPTYLYCAVCGQRHLYDCDDLLPFPGVLIEMEVQSEAA